MKKWVTFRKWHIYMLGVICIFLGMSIITPSMMLGIICLGIALALSIPFAIFMKRDKELTEKNNGKNPWWSL
jgi:hypothetical protein